MFGEYLGIQIWFKFLFTLGWHGVPAFSEGSLEGEGLDLRLKGFKPYVGLKVLDESCRASRVDIV